MTVRVLCRSRRAWGRYGLGPYIQLRREKSFPLGSCTIPTWKIISSTSGLDVHGSLRKEERRPELHEASHNQTLHAKRLRRAG